MRIGEVVRAWRWREELSVREAARQIGVTYPSLIRIEKGNPMMDENLAILLRWLLQ